MLLLERDSMPGTGHQSEPFPCVRAISKREQRLGAWRDAPQDHDQEDGLPGRPSLDLHETQSVKGGSIGCSRSGTLRAALRSGPAARLM